MCGHAVLHNILQNIFLEGPQLEEVKEHVGQVGNKVQVSKKYTKHYSEKGYINSSTVACVHGGNTPGMLL